MTRAPSFIWRWLSPGLVFGWAVAEATVWPIMPDAVLVPLALARPSSWWRLVLAAALGTTVGGAISYVLARHWPLTLLCALVFGVGLWRAVVFWERRGP